MIIFIAIACYLSDHSTLTGSRIKRRHVLSILASTGAWTVLPGATAPKPKNDYTQDQLRPYLSVMEWILYSLDPTPWAEDANDPFGSPAPTAPEESKKLLSAPPFKPKRKVSPDQEFHEYPILGQLHLRENEKLKYVIHALNTAGQNWMGGVASCFSPRHGIRVTYQGKVHDLVICYECSAASLYVDGKHAGFIKFLTTPQFQATPYPLDGLLRKAGIKSVPLQH